MEDQFLHDLKRDPDPAFESQLRERLRTQDPAPETRAAGTHFPWRTAGAVAFAGAVAVIVFAVPSVRVSAQSFLDIFRVRNFAAVPVDPERIARLESETIDLQRMMAKNVEVLQAAGEPREVESADAASRAVGFAVRAPEYLSGLEPGVITVKDQGRVRMTADAAALEEMLRLLDIRDARIPANLDGAIIEVRMPASVHMRYAKEGRMVRWMQSASPDVRLPPAMDLEDLGAIALRITGMGRQDAESMARSIDWHTTLLVPVPATARSFRKVHVHGEPGLLIESTRGTDDVPSGPRGSAVVMWAENGMVYALSGNVNEAELLEMAESVR
jgi:hypothetical protein